MKNKIPEFIGESLAIVDRKILDYMVNPGVRGWNWLTGETKSDLANKLLIIAPFLEITGVSMLSPVATPIFSLFPISSSYLSIKSNKSIDKQELNALENGLLDYGAERIKSLYKYGCYLFPLGGASLYAATSSFPEENFYYGNSELSGSLLLGAEILRSASYFIMRADSLPPRKNAFSRGADKLTEVVRDYRKKKLLPG